MRCLAITLLLLLPLTAQAQKGIPLQSVPGQTVEVPKFDATVAEQKCEEWAWAAALDTVLALQGVKLGQRHWITRLHGGELCRDDLGRLEDLPALVDGEYVLDDGSKARVAARFRAGAPTSVDDLIVSLRAGRPLILFWKDHAYLLCGLVYDEYIAPNGARIYEVREMTLRDPYFGSGEKQFAKFVKGSDDANEIDGLMQVTVTPVESQSWKSKN